jgi:hypothetical protein
MAGVDRGTSGRIVVVGGSARLSCQRKALSKKRAEGGGFRDKAVAFAEKIESGWSNYSKLRQVWPSLVESLAPTILPEIMA